MPSTWLRWGTDADGDGIADPWNPVDAIYSAARYLAASGAPQRHPAGRLLLQPRDVVRERRDGSSRSSTPAPALGARPAARRVVSRSTSSRRSSTTAQAAVTRASARVPVAASRAQVLAASASRPRRARAESRRSSPTGWTPRSGRRRSGVVADAAQARPTGCGRELDAAQRGARRAQDTAQAASFNQPARPAALRGAGAGRSGDYVFPVGGGPSIVSVSHTHHDYPAADIAAPEGAPLYALTDGTVLYAWPGRRPLRHRLHDAGDGRPDLDVLPPLLHRARRAVQGAAADGGPAGRSRRPHGRRDRAAPASPAPAGDVVSAGRGSGSSPSRALPSSGRTTPPGRRPASPAGSARLPHRQPSSCSTSSLGRFWPMTKQEWSQFATGLLRGVVATFAGLLIAGGTLTLAADRAATQRPTLVPAAQGPTR